MQTVDYLRDLIGFDTTSVNPNRALIDYCARVLRDAGAQVQIIPDVTGTKANLYATLGPVDVPGVLLSGHTDVVPVTGQDWTHPPFALTHQDGKLYGRGTADMKGFVAAALRIAVQAGQVWLTTPLHLALSYDEEVGCIGVRSLIDMLAIAPFRPRFCIVGEPTLMAVATGHKGKTAYRVTCTGVEGHSALAPLALNAIHLATDMIMALRTLQAQVMQTGAQDPGYDVPYTTLHVGLINGGTVLNIVPNTCTFAFEIRHLPDDDPALLLAQLRVAADRILAPVCAEFPQADIRIDLTNAYPPLGTLPDADVVRFVKSLTGANGTTKVAFGTEGGLFAARLGVPTVICGPGSMAQGHRPDEFVALEQLDRCDAMLDALLQRLRSGL